MSLHDELIEAMLDAVMREDGKSREDYTPEEWELGVRQVTAAYAALREKLVPVAYHRHHKDGGTGLGRFPMTEREQADGWTETPLYHLPEIKDAD